MKPRRVLVARVDNAGDVLLTGPAVRAIAASGADITYLAGPAGAPAARRLPGVRQVIEADLPWVGYQPPPASPQGIEALVAQIARGRFDEAILFTSDHQSALPTALLARLAGVPRIVAESRDHPGSLIDVRLRYTTGHEVERRLALVAEAGYALPGDDDRRLSVEARTSGWFDDQCIREPFVVVHCGASVPARALGAARAGLAVDRLVDAGWTVVLTGGVHDLATTAPIAARHSPHVVRDLAGASTFDELVEIIGRAAVVVAGNTGPAHVAAAVGTPVVSVFAPVVPWKAWKPWMVPVRRLGDVRIECGGCRARVCPRPKQPCLDPATPAAIASAVADLAGAPRRLLAPARGA